MADSARSESCPMCKTELQRVYTSFHLKGAKVEDSFYSHALGKVVSSRRQEAIEANAKGMIEVGNEDLKKHTKPVESKYPTVDELYKLGAFN